MGIMVEMEDFLVKKQIAKSFGIYGKIAFDHVKIIRPVVRPESLPMVSQLLLTAGLQNFCEEDLQ